ncbi:MAG: efflux RND transporter periplasmic adaptor subunit, partial [Planctomycetota bacterium]
LNAYPGRTWTGAVDFVGATLDESTRTLPIRVEIERVGDDLDAMFNIYIDGEPVATNVECDRLTSSRQPINFGVFVGGEAGRRADLIMDDARVVRRR